MKPCVAVSSCASRQHILFFFSCVLCAEWSIAVGRSLRGMESGFASLRFPVHEHSLMAQLGSGMVADVHGRSEPVEFEVLSRKSFEQVETTSCSCKKGQFWHWQINSCIDQGGWGYECGFFPYEHQRLACQDGLKCVSVTGTQEFGVNGERAATCVPCKPEDFCRTGEARYLEQCVKNITVVGEACANVEVSVLANPSAKAAFANVGKTIPRGKDTKSASANQTVFATVANGTSSATPGGRAEVRANVSATVSVRMKGRDTGQAMENVAVDATHASRVNAVAVEKKIAESSAKPQVRSQVCLSVDDVKRSLGIDGISSVSPVLSAQLISAGDERAFHLAYEKALTVAKLKAREEAAGVA
eukprot:TRINITY_DN25206_c0_g1_i1.p1 TRINITY_DN25206_c0_g1~~TRINITY_DN25206_c0_g1_i1.p1  ORF type:complete len:359 (+),score=43.67 TRINITY_DN25206_c0_g1_i1:244-1320(+)